MLETWAAKDMWMRKSDGHVLCRREAPRGKTYQLLDFDSGEVVGTFAKKSDLKQLKPNSGIRAMIGTALGARSS